MSRAQITELDALRDDLVMKFSPSIEDLDPVPMGTVEQARRFAMVMADLMRQGAFDYEALAEGWDVSLAAARKRVLRACERSKLFTVTYRDRTFVPGFLLDERLSLRPELPPVLAASKAGGDKGFALWVWLTTPTSWLDGAVPNDLLKSDSERVVRAVTQRSSHNR